VQVNVRAASRAELPFLGSADVHLSTAELEHIVDDQRVLIADQDATPVGFLRWGLFWDEIPFMNLLYVLPAHRGSGIGSRLVAVWEQLQLAAGHSTVLTSSLANERAQQLYRRLGYLDSGCLLLPDEPTEIIFRKVLDG
jgi:ribosomal protein S18 acetylase RimI-like enzyme